MGREEQGVGGGPSQEDEGRNGTKIVFKGKVEIPPERGGKEGNKRGMKTREEARQRQRSVLAPGFLSLPCSAKLTLFCRLVKGNIFCHCCTTSYIGLEV